MRQIIGFLLCVLIFGGVVWLCIVDERHWQAYSAEHHCEIVAIQRAQTSWISGTDGHLHTITTPETKTYSCDAGALSITR